MLGRLLGKARPSQTQRAVERARKQGKEAYVENVIEGGQMTSRVVVLDSKEDQRRHDRQAREARRRWKREFG